MADWHLKELENNLNQKGWIVSSRINGNGYNISSSWIISRSLSLQIDFEGLNDMETLPTERAYGCSVKDRALDLYFYSKGEKWKKNLLRFITEIEKLQ